jgi:hypothetical protein
LEVSVRESRDRNTDSQGTTFMWVEHYGELASPTLDAFTSLGFATAVAILAHGAAYFVAMERLT